MPKPKTRYNDLELWRDYCERLRKQPFPKTDADFMKVAVPDVHDRISKNWDDIGDGGPIPSLPFDGDQGGEMRVPIARAITAIRSFKRVKTENAKRRHLGVALAWLECPHPWQGEKTKSEIAIMIKDIRYAIEEPMVTLDHLLDDSLYFRFHPKIEVSAQEHADTIITLPGTASDPVKRPSLLGRIFGRLIGRSQG